MFLCVCNFSIFLLEITWPISRNPYMTIARKIVKLNIKIKSWSLYISCKKNRLNASWYIPLFRLLLNLIGSCLQIFPESSKYELFLITNFLSVFMTLLCKKSLVMCSCLKLFPNSSRYFSYQLSHYSLVASFTIGVFSWKKVFC